MEKLKLVVTVFIVLFGIFAIVNNLKSDKIGKSQISPNVVEMPIVQDVNPLTSKLKCVAPQPNRNEEYRKYLAASVKIYISNGRTAYTGSGTIVYYDYKTQEAYIASCGHLWNGEKTAAELRKNPIKCRIMVWYHNNLKLDKYKEYEVTVLFYNNAIRGHDSSLMKFKADWIPNYFPIAKADYEIPVGSHQHSCGCDNGSESAEYNVKIIGYRSIIDNAWRDTGEIDLITIENSPRPGRSGGGLISNDGYYIGTCWGTSKEDGSGIGYFTSLKAIHRMYEKNGFGWLLKIGKGIAKRVPIYDKNNPKIIYSDDYIKIPEKPILVPR